MAVYINTYPAGSTHRVCKRGGRYTNECLLVLLSRHCWFLGAFSSGFTKARKDFEVLHESTFCRVSTNTRKHLESSAKKDTKIHFLVIFSHVFPISGAFLITCSRAGAQVGAHTHTHTHTHKHAQPQTHQHPYSPPSHPHVKAPGSLYFHLLSLTHNTHTHVKAPGAAWLSPPLSLPLSFTHTHTPRTHTHTSKHLVLLGSLTPEPLLLFLPLLLNALRGKDVG